MRRPTCKCAMGYYEGHCLACGKCDREVKTTFWYWWPEFVVIGCGGWAGYWLAGQVM